VLLLELFNELVVCVLGAYMGAEINSKSVSAPLRLFPNIICGKLGDAASRLWMYACAQGCDAEAVEVYFSIWFLRPYLDSRVNQLLKPRDVSLGRKSLNNPFTHSVECRLSRRLMGPCL
jgi:hypothetical protein